MRDLVLFCEDSGHEVFLEPLIARLAREQGVDIKLRPLSVRGGKGKAIHELKEYGKELLDGRSVMPDILVVAIDGNCHGYPQRRQEIENAVPDEFHHRLVCAIPDPHIERWFLSAVWSMPRASCGT